MKNFKRAVTSGLACCVLSNSPSFKGFPQKTVAKCPYFILYALASFSCQLPQLKCSEFIPNHSPKISSCITMHSFCEVIPEHLYEVGYFASCEFRAASCELRVANRQTRFELGFESILIWTTWKAKSKGFLFHKY